MVNLINAKFSCILFKMQVFIMVDYGKIVDEKVLANSTKMCYTYDSLNRVTSRTVKRLADNSVISTEIYTYDAAGNLTDAPDSCFGYDINNRLTVFNGNDVSYDMDGNMLSNGTTDFEYDSANRLIKAGNHAYTYNAEDVRIRNLCGDYDTTYTYNTNCKLSQLLQKTTNGIITKYVYGLGLIGEEKQECGFKTYHFDYRGSTVAITDISGNITDTFKYDTYGKVTDHIGDSYVIFGYNGRDGVVTDKNGLIYMRARYYSPNMRRFVNADIIHGEISDSTSLNRYSYVNGNPVSFVDPFGLSKEDRGSSKASTNYYQAILVTDFSLPIVGHAEIYFLSDDGNIYWTEFNATAQSSKLNELKKSAQVRKRSSTSIDYKNELKGKHYVVLNGDFNESQKLAEQYYNEQRMGRYNFFFNNCSDYIDAILNVADVDGMFAQIQIGGDSLISIPIVRGLATSAASGMDSITNAISDGFVSVGEYVKNYWGWGGSALVNVGEFIDTSSNWIGDSVGGLLQKATDTMEPINKAINKGANQLWDWGTSVWNYISSLF